MQTPHPLRVRCRDSARALGQRPACGPRSNPKRKDALVGLAAGTESGIRGVLIYMAIYLVMTAGSFAVVLSMPAGSARVRS